jgi:enamine deaminase RidA (YjgF/YER057c/UK114 family)
MIVNDWIPAFAGMTSARNINTSQASAFVCQPHIGEHFAMTRQLISSGSTFERDIGYSRAVVDGEWIFVSGTTGFNYQTMTIADDVVAQTEQCMQNISAALLQAGSSLNDVVRVTYVLPKADEFPLCWPVLRKYFGDIRPAAMMISAGLADPRMKIEIEVTAKKSIA